jgi:acetyl-CoA carboxylase, biotin carboxylase subunit
MGAAAIKAARAVDYEGAGTVEFLVDKHRNFYFMEMNTRIQVEHTVTEEALGIDLVKEQILVAAGEKLSISGGVPRRHAIECRINAEDPYHNYRPSPGAITALHFPGGPGIRIDSHIYQGYSIPPHYDSMIAKLISIGKDRNEAIARMKRALQEFVIEGIQTTIPFHLKMMGNKDFISGEFDTKYLDNNNWQDF